ncbi:hypothetical protein ABIE38_002611 [Dietzia sp. 2505]
MRHTQSPCLLRLTRESGQCGATLPRRSSLPIVNDQTDEELLIWRELVSPAGGDLPLAHVHWTVVDPIFIQVHEVLDPGDKMAIGCANVFAPHIAEMG